MQIVILLALAIVPGVALVVWFKRQDHYQPEPWWVIKRAFYAGAFIVIPAGLIEHWLHSGKPAPHDFFACAVFAFIIVALTEELAKLAMILYSPYQDRHFDEVMDGIVYGAAVAAGFATFENVFYVLSHGIAVGIIRAVVSVPLHILEGAIIGYWVARVRFSGTDPVGGYLYGLGLAVFIHGSFDFACFTAKAEPRFLFAVPVLLYGSWRLVKSYIRSALAESRAELLASGGVIPVEELTPALLPPESPLAVLWRTALFGAAALSVCTGAFFAIGCLALFNQGRLEFIHCMLALVPLLFGRYLFRLSRPPGQSSATRKDANASQLTDPSQHDQ